LTGLDKSVLQIKTKIVSSHTADSKPVKQEVNGTVILPHLVFPAHHIGDTYINLEHKQILKRTLFMRHSIIVHEEKIFP
jgi:hypothetical protein